MIKGLLIAYLLLISGYCFLCAEGVKEWFPDFAPQCKRDENLRNNYLSEERKSVENSISEMNKRNINIIPAPKNLFFSGKDISISLKDVITRVSIFADKSSAVAADIIIKKLGIPAEIKELDDYRNDSEISIVLLRQDINAKNSLLPEKIPDFYQGYVIKTEDKTEKRTYLLAGKDYSGLLYAAVTFSKLITSGQNNLIFPGIAISDWPDIRYRMAGGLFNYNFKWGEKGKGAKKFIDFLLMHKINMIHSKLSYNLDEGLYHPYDKRERDWLKEICDYAKARGIFVIHETHTEVGDFKNDKNDQAYKDCIVHNKSYWCWSNDELIKKRGERLVQYLKDTGLSAVFIHTMDTTNSKWHDRCMKCRERFGDDRFKGDANLFNHYYNAIRKSFPEIPIVIVPRPYSEGVDSPIHLERGEIKQTGDLKRFSEMLPKDIYICHREVERTSSLSWTKAFEQPMCTYVIAHYWAIPLQGRSFTPFSRYFRTFNYPLSDEIGLYPITGSTSNTCVECLVMSEFTWNLNSPGSADFLLSEKCHDSKKSLVDDIWDPFGKDMSKNKKLQTVLKRACDDYFGPEYAKYFYGNFNLFIDAMFVRDYENYRPALQKLMPNIGDKECVEIMERIYNDTEKAIKNMEDVLKITPRNPEIAMFAKNYLQSYYPLCVLSHLYALALKADYVSKKSDFKEASLLMEECFKTYDDGLKKLKNEWSSIYGQKCESSSIPLWSNTEKNLKSYKNILEMINIKIQSRETMAKRRKNTNTATKEKPKDNKPVIVGLFVPDLNGGKTYGSTGLFNLLKGINDISVEQVSNLSPDILKKYDCIIFPDCKSLGNVDVNLAELRIYVIENGGGIYFEHDSCGFNRFPLKNSVFPEISNVKNRTGEHLSRTDYKKEDRILKIAKKHPVTVGNLENSYFEQVYYDHLQLENGMGTILVEDTYGKPVIIAGQVGNGKVIFNGGITLSSDDSELDKPLSGIEGELILNSIYWLAKDKKGTELIMSDLKKTDTTLTDMQASVISFKPQIIPCKILHDAVLTVQCFNARDMRPISSKTEIAKIAEINEKWESDENVIINAEVYPQIKVILELSSKEGKDFTSQIVGSEK